MLFSYIGRYTFEQSWSIITQCSRITFSAVHRNPTAAINRPGNFAQFNSFESIQQLLHQTFLAVSGHWDTDTPQNRFVIKTTVIAVPSGRTIRLANNRFDKNSKEQNVTLENRENRFVIIKEITTIWIDNDTEPDEHGRLLVIRKIQSRFLGRPIVLYLKI